MTNLENFVLVIDEDREAILNVLFTVFKGTGNMDMFFQTDEGAKLKPIFMDLLQEISDKAHEKGWCKDPRCPESKSVNIKKQLEDDGT